MSEFFRLDEDASARRLLYIAAMLLIVIPVLQIMSQIWPMDLFSIQWRFGAANALSSVLLLPFLGLTCIALVVRAVEDRTLAKIIGLLCAVTSLLLVASCVLYLLDSLQLKAIIQSRMMSQFNSTMARVLMVSAIFAIAFAVLAAISLKAPSNRATADKGNIKGNEERIGLIIGQDEGRPQARAQEPWTAKGTAESAAESAADAAKSPFRGALRDE